MKIQRGIIRNISLYISLNFESLLPKKKFIKLKNNSGNISVVTSRKYAQLRAACILLLVSVEIKNIEFNNTRPDKIMNGPVASMNGF